MRSTMTPLDRLFACLAASPFRQRFHLSAKDAAYLQRKGPMILAEHARRFIGERLAPAHPENDGKQTPMRGHPVFVAQHATATCCRGCLETWHGIAKGRALTAQQQEHAVAAILRWLELEAAALPDAVEPQPTLALAPVLEAKPARRRKPSGPPRCAATLDMFA